MSVCDIDPTIDRAVFSAVAEALKQSGSLIRESVHRRRDGSTFPVELNINLVHLDQELHRLRCSRYYERKRTDAALRQERIARNATWILGEVILLALDLEGKVTFINRKGCSILGWKESELLGRDWTKCLPVRIKNKSN